MEINLFAFALGIILGRILYKPCMELIEKIKLKLRKDIR